MKRQKPLHKPKHTIKATEPVGDRYRLPGFAIRLTEDRDGIIVPNRIQLFRTGTYQKLMEDGKTVTFSITPEILEEMKENFDNRVRGIDIALDFAHRSDDEAAAWFKELELTEGEDGETELWGNVDWTPDGYAAVASKKFRYISPDFAFGSKDNETGKKFGATLFGAGLTNRPVIKNMAPIVELTEVKDMAKKTTKGTGAKKKLTDFTVEELKAKLSEEKNEERKVFIQEVIDHKLELEEMDEGDDDGDEEPAPPPKKKPAEMNLEELQDLCTKQSEELADLRKQMTKQAAETQSTKKNASFDKLLVEGKVVEAQRAAFIEGDTVKFAELAEKTKYEAVGEHGDPVEGKTTAQDKVLELAQEKVEKKLARTQWEAIPMVLAENKKLNQEYEKEMSEPLSA